MDRPTFLSCLPYFTTAPSNEWPPRALPHGSRYERLLDGQRYQVCIEVVPQQDAKEDEEEDKETNEPPKKKAARDASQPPREDGDDDNNSEETPRLPQRGDILHFLSSSDNNDAASNDNRRLPSNKNTDATMCGIEFGVERSEIPTQPAVSALLQGSGRRRKRRPQPKATAESCTALHVRLDGQTYIVDWRALQEMRLEPGTTVPRTCPCHLLLIFPCLQWRVFPLGGSQKAMDTLLDELEDVQTRLAEALMQLERAPMLFPPSFWKDRHQQPSPSSSTTMGGSSSSSGLIQAAARKVDEDATAQTEENEKKQSANDTVFQRHHVAYQQCQSSIQSLQTVLAAPLSCLSASTATAGKQDAEALVSPLLSATAEHLTAAYIHPQDLATESTRLQRVQSAQLQASLAPLLDQFFPRRQRRKRARWRYPMSKTAATPTIKQEENTKKKVATTTQDDEDKKPAAKKMKRSRDDRKEEVAKIMVGVYTVLRHHQRETQQRHALLCVPTRALDSPGNH